MLLSGPSWLHLKNYQLGSDNNTSNLRAQFFFKNKKLLKPYFIVFFWQTVFCEKTNLAQIITPQKAKLGPDNNTTAYIYIYIYAVKLLTGPRLAILIVTNWATLIVTNWATSFSHYKNRGFRWFLGAQLSVCVFLFPVIFQLSKNSLFQKRGAKMFFFSIFSVLS